MSDFSATEPVCKLKFDHRGRVGKPEHCLGSRTKFEINFFQKAKWRYWTSFAHFFKIPRLLKKNAAKRPRQHARIVFHQKSSSTEGRIPPKVAFHWSSSSTEGQLPLKFVFHWKLSSTEGHLPTKVVFHRRSSSFEGRLPPKVIFYRRSSFTEGRLSLTITPWLILYLWEKSIYQISVSYLA